MILFIIILDHCCSFLKAQAWAFWEKKLLIAPVATTFIDNTLWVSGSPQTKIVKEISGGLIDEETQGIFRSKCIKWLALTHQPTFQGLAKNLSS